ncbi:putative WhiB family regulatory protein [Gordonia namibiensis NBRC 108229]|uniref:Putative WhiB family regulatory protein n=1 Tax=Gordonia namibiensis NBRC 108229 TaxID=1208314 RepID=K6XNW6_9ACTN|nr:putative WhiB family regulatory protein [Gordonia namibiensis NBRC 108229]
MNRTNRRVNPYTTRRPPPPTTVIEHAACRDDPGLFDAPSADWSAGPERERVAKAKATCAACPVLAPCAQWSSSLPRSSLDGIVSGRLYRTPSHSRGTTHN